MLLRVASDLHLENKNFSFYELPEDKDSVAVLAGDISVWNSAVGRERLECLLVEMSSQFRQVFMVCGNHEFYKKGNVYKIPRRINEWLFDKKLCNVRVLDDDCVVVDDVAFIGATMWTDYDKGDPTCKALASGYMADYSQSTNGNGRLTPNDLLTLHMKSRRYVFDKCSEMREGGLKTVIITHHGVSTQSIHAKYLRGGYTNYYFVSNLVEEILDAKPDLMIHGHVHDPFDYIIDGPDHTTRVVVNPRGYVPHENNGFDEFLQIEI